MAQRCASSCKHCRKGIPFETWSYCCLLCNCGFCDECYEDHPSDHAKWYRRLKFHETPRGAKPNPVECQKCLKMTHTRVYCTQCDENFCGDCFDENPRACVESHTAHKKLEVVVAPDTAVLAQTEPCRACPATGSVLHCPTCNQGIPSGQTVVQCLTCVNLYGSGCAFCPACTVQGMKAHDLTHVWMKLRFDFQPGAEATWMESRCKECLEVVDISNTRKLAKHACNHKDFIASYGPAIQKEFIKQRWLKCPSRPDKDVRMEDEENLSKTAATCLCCGSGFLNQQTVYFCLSCLLFACPACAKEGPSTNHEHGEWTEVMINCEKPPNNLGQLSQENYQKHCSICKDAINIWCTQNLYCITCRDWFVCPRCLLADDSASIHHTCANLRSSNEEHILVLDDTYPMEPAWWSHQTVLLARQTDPSPPQVFVISPPGQQFKAKDAEDMNIFIGDHIAVMGDAVYNDWYWGRNDWTGERGVFPKQCVQIDEEAVRVARELGWLQVTSASSSSAPAGSYGGGAGGEVQRGADPTLTAAKMHHSDAKMKLWGGILKFGAAVLGAS